MQVSYIYFCLFYFFLDVSKTKTEITIEAALDKWGSWSISGLSKAFAMLNRILKRCRFTLE